METDNHDGTDTEATPIPVLERVDHMTADCTYDKGNLELHDG